MTLIGINSNIPAAIVSNSIQFGGPTETVFLQAVDGGLDLVAIDGASVMDPIANGMIAAVARNGVTIKDAKDFVGKKVGAPGIGAFLHVLFVKWLIEKGVDPKSVNFVEVTFPTMNDALKSGAVDAVLTAEPFISRMQSAGTGTVAARYAAELGRTEPIISYATTRSFAEQESRRHQGLPRLDRGSRCNRQFRSRKGERRDRQVHPPAARDRAAQSPGPRRAEAESRATSPGGST